ncbi:MAG TPA: hypothetical protein VFD06_14840 [Candidatus Polarisedimenticolia bacterium]|nr:hypothetical protein [Candidatus Polarisedimenticolia bacterium]
MQGEPRGSRLPLPLLASLLVLAGPLLWAPLVIAQQTTPSGQTQAPPPSQTQTPPQTGTTPSTQPTTGQQILGPDGKPFVPPTPPPPSQSRIPGAFDTSLIPASAPRFTFTPTLTLQEQWTDNFFLTETGRTENFRTTAAVGLDLLMNLPNTRGSLSTSLAGSYDSAPDEEQANFFPSFTGSVQHTFSPRLSLTISDTFRRDDDPFLSDPNGVRRERDTFISNTFSASVNWLIDIFQTQYYYRNNLFLSDDSDTISHILGGNVAVPLGAIHTLSGGYEFTFRDSSGDSDQIGNRVYGSLSRQIGTFTSAGVSSSFSWISANTDSRIFNVSLFAAHGIPGGFSVSGSVGYSLYDSETADQPTHLASFSLNASYRFARGIVSLGVFQDIRQTADEGQDFGIVTTRSATFSASYSFTAFITGSIYARYSRNEPLEGGGSNLASSSTYLTAGANLSWQITNWLSLTLAYLYIDRDSDNSTNIGSNDIPLSQSQFLQNSTENRATATLSARF